MVLWADAILEYKAIGGEEEGKGSGYEPLDRLDPIYRRMYFWRALAITLSSAQKLLNRLISDPEFKEWMDKYPEARTEFLESKRDFDRNIQRVNNEVRNRISAHIEEDVGEAPKHLAPGVRGFFDVGGPDGMRPRLAFELILAALLPGIPVEEQNDKMMELLVAEKQAFVGMVNAMVVAVDLYRRHYPLLP